MSSDPRGRGRVLTWPCKLRAGAHYRPAEVGWRVSGFPEKENVRRAAKLVFHSLASLFTHRLLSTNLSHSLTTTFIVGRLLGFCFQQLSRNFHISTVNPTSPAFCGISGLPPDRISGTTLSFSFPANGISPVKTSTANIAKANTSAGFDSSGGVVPHLREGSIISGASHLEVPTAPGVAVMVKLGLELMGANPYSVKRARPSRSMMTFACGPWSQSSHEAEDRRRKKQRGKVVVEA